MCQQHGCVTVSVTDTHLQFFSLCMRTHTSCMCCVCLCVWDCEIEGTRKRAMIKFEVSGMVSTVSDPLPVQIPRVGIQKRPLSWKFLWQHVLWKAWPVGYTIAIKSLFHYSLLSNLEERNKIILCPLNDSTHADTRYMNAHSTVHKANNEGGWYSWTRPAVTLDVMSHGGSGQSISRSSSFKHP